MSHRQTCTVGYGTICGLASRCTSEENPFGCGVNLNLLSPSLPFFPLFSAECAKPAFIVLILMRIRLLFPPNRAVPLTWLLSPPVVVHTARSRISSRAAGPWPLYGRSTVNLYSASRHKPLPESKKIKLIAAPRGLEPLHPNRKRWQLPVDRSPEK